MWLFKEQLKGYPSEYPLAHLSMVQTYYFFPTTLALVNVGNILVIMAGKFTTFFIFQWQKQSNQVNE